MDTSTDRDNAARQINAHAPDPEVVKPDGNDPGHSTILFLIRI